MVGWAWLLVILNSLDGIATYLGITLLLISEANPLLTRLDPLMILMIKLFLSTVFAVFILKYPFHQFGNSVKYLLSFANACYLCIFAFHLFWIGMSIMA
ncbi:DUF5658 family protein [Paenisporosarcina sp. NPDC076898]|uniref:DUF5658 family protein n=1 Tax=unclassified Paenisporosarcina TaxID=2642018 RepID=UPI003D0300CD